MVDNFNIYYIGNINGSNEFNRTAVYSRVVRKINILLGKGGGAKDV